MDNKKPLILVPPLSEPLSKLKEVLEGISSEENIEIFTVTDAKEFAQLIGSGGQALVMLSNAKVCATLLQENKALITKNHTKVLLMTPKEIPVKTLEKFRKIGLTESILESTAPKTLLYKVKLQLKSIKLTQKEDNSQQLVKSMLDGGPKIKVADEMIMEGDTANTPVVTESAFEEKKIKNTGEGENLDYLSNLHGKKKQSAEDVIETHWKTKKDKVENNSTEDEEGNLKTKSSEDESDIDMYYRGKMKKDDNNILEEETEPTKRNKVSMEEEVADYKIKKEKTEEAIEPIEKRRKNQAVEDSEDYTEKKEKTTALEEVEAKKKKENKIEDEEDLDIEELQKRLLDQIEEADKKRNGIEAEDLGGHYKGKIKKQEEAPPEDEITQEKDDVIETVSIEKKRKHDALEEEAEDEITKERQVLAEDESNPHEGEVDQIDTYMRGDMESTEAIKDRMESKTESKKEKIDEVESDLERKRKSDLMDADEEDFFDKKEVKTELEFDSSDLKKEKLIAEADDKDYKREALLAEDEENDFRKKNLDKVEKAEAEREDKENSRSTKLEELSERQGGQKAEEEDFNRKEVDTKLDIEKSRERDVHEGQTDKISTYYKSGESKKQDQDWNLTHDKKNTQLEVTKTKKDDIDLGALKKGPAGEEVIDYRKLKEEFDLISKGELSNDGTGATASGAKRGNGINAEDSFKVVEVGPTPFDFAVEIITAIYSPDIKVKDIYKMVAEKLLTDEKCIIAAYQISIKDNKLAETYSAYTDLTGQVADEHKSEWQSIKEDDFNKELFNSFTMPTWMCRTIPDNDSFWRDIELPQWANQELTDKKVELVYPFFNGVERLGYVHLYFPNGVTPKNEKKIQITVEMLRSVFLENAIKKTRQQESTNRDEEPNENVEKKNNVIGFLGGLFGKKKAS